MVEILAGRRQLLGTLPGQIFPIDLMGVSKNQAKPLLWRYERLPLPSPLLGASNDSKKCDDKLRVALESAETAGTILWQTMFRLAMIIATPPGGLPPGKDATRSVLVGLYDAGQYWQLLEEPFAEFMYQLADEAPEADAALDVWTERVRDVAASTFRGIVTSLGDSPSALKASSRVASAFYSRLRTIGGVGS
jgi:hypothetical protein